MSLYLEPQKKKHFENLRFIFDIRRDRTLKLNSYEYVTRIRLDLEEYDFDIEHLKKEETVEKTDFTFTVKNSRMS